MGTGDFEAARRELLEALKVEPLAPEAHANLGLVSVQERDAATAVGHYGQALKLAPNEPTIQRLMAAALLEPGPKRNPEAARQAARRATRLAPRDAAAWEALARACDGLNDARCAAEARGHIRQLLAGVQ
jgi:Flp pilus assembly protein TadD